MNELSSIRNYLRIDQRLATSGMPKADDFGAIRDAGFKVVINLAMPTSDNALPNESDLVTRSGMSYVQIPVNFEAPQPADFDRFASIMDALGPQPVFVHCAANMRVSAFVFLHRVLGGARREDAERDLKRIWNPDGVWRQLINQRLAAAGHSPLS